MDGWELNERIMRDVLHWVYEPRFPGDGSGAWITLQGERIISENLPDFSGDMTAAWQVVDLLAGLWTHATEGVPGTAGYIPDPPFDDGCFFDILHRHADRRWPWAFLYVTPAVICEAALHAFGVHPDQQEGIDITA